MSVTEGETGLTFPAFSLPWIADEKRLTELTLFSHCVVVAMQAFVQLVCRRALRVEITLTRDSAAVSHIREEAFAFVWGDASAEVTALRANGLTE